jgi:catechol 2,3-dioxygenase-like lactoylglutathione lyase family enzyme
MNRLPVTHFIHGPIISSSEIEVHAELLAAFGMVEQLRLQHSVAACSEMWGTEGLSATELVMGTPDTPYGARIVQFSPLSAVAIRDRDRGYDADAPKVIDFYVRDLVAARRYVEAAGWRFREPLAEYDLPEGHFTEAHVWAQDEFVCALIHGPPEFFAKFCVLTDRMFSEPQSLSGAVSQFEPSIAFFEQVLDLAVVYRYGISDDSFRQLVGSARPQFNLRAVNMGLTTEEPYIGLIHYGMPEESYASLHGRARPPHRGILGATIVVRDVDEVVRRARAVGGEVLAAPVACVHTVWGPARVATLLAANGGCYQVVQRGE